MTTLGLVIVILATGIVVTIGLGVLMKLHSDLKGQKELKRMKYLVNDLLPRFEQEQVNVSTKTMEKFMECMSRMIDESIEKFKKLNEDD